MDRDWSECFEIVKDKFNNSLWADEFGKSKKGMARLFGISTGAINAWEKGQWPSAKDLTLIAEKLGFGHRWLVTGEGDPYTGGHEPKILRIQPTPIPVVGLVSCGVDGWEQATPSALSASTPVFGAHWLAAIAFGDSMTPVGIHPGHICYCDPEQLPLANDAVYVTRKDGLATIKVFVGEGERGPGWLRLKGWTPANGSGFRREFFIDLLTKDVEKIAPVIYVRRRI